MKILVAIIAYNEEKNILSVIDELREFAASGSGNGGDTYDIVVIDNGSSDSTAEVCKEAGVPVVSHCMNSGGSGGTITTYFAYAYFHGYDVLAQFDGDGQHVASELPKILNPIADGETDYIIGSRYIEKQGFQSTFSRRLGIGLFNNIITGLTGVTVTDCTSGFRAYGRDVIRFFAKGYQHEIYDPVQLVALAHFSGARIKEVPIVMRERLHGESEFNIQASILFPLRASINLLGCYLRRGVVVKGE